MGRCRNQPKPPGATKAAGYDAAHKRRRAAAHAAMPEGAPCVLCGRPMYSWMRLHPDQTDSRTGYLGLSHASCNVAAGNRSPRRRLRRTWRPAIPAAAAPPLRTSRQW